MCAVGSVDGGGLVAQRGVPAVVVVFGEPGAIQSGGDRCRALIDWRWGLSPQAMGPARAVRVVLAEPVVCSQKVVEVVSAGGCTRDLRVLHAPAGGLDDRRCSGQPQRRPRGEVGE